jgi:hypothetical protein
MDLELANEFVKRHHRHHKPTPGAKFCIGVIDGESLRGVAIVGRPVSRHFDDGWTLEVNRCCTDGAKNACSMLYAAARKTAQSLGYRRIVTYTLPAEGGASLKASGWRHCGEAGGGNWSCNVRKRDDDFPTERKWLWECVLKTDETNFDWRSLKEDMKETQRGPSLF